MSTRSAGLDEALAGLSAGARRWTARHAPYLDSPAARAELPVVPRVKALLQLAMLRRSWERCAPADPLLPGVTGVVERAWRDPDLPRLLTLEGRHARQFELMYGALDPAGAATGAPRAVLDRLAAGSYLTPGRKPPFLHLEARFYADLAGVPHRFAPYEELYAASPLPRAATLPVADLDGCQVAHTLCYLGDFGLRGLPLPEDERERALRVVERLTEHCVGLGDWDVTAKLLLAQYCLGADPLRTPSGAAGLRMLHAAQAPDGAVPGRCAAERAPADATPVEYFRKSYKVTLVVALMTLVVTGGRTGEPALTAATAVRENL
ncbi:hypothetical protein EF912_01850 [Streptomyces sp. WAC07061]|uniref:DUF6895 family protein n=1 Tax=Streptomyces sp. WAC07061 TaxID=2487410 RepID=UPI000F7AE6D0|nr:hypothetical protein [Streptomyces sp. WAC07061]RSS64715.1 hypothetical protein EF912_01850 [Streptomyces sp. WAC07061]